tara:strand:- start:1201 stop:2544 length:1344 start_codon:yes stop_codon:yes gene_type:complete
MRNKVIAFVPLKLNSRRLPNKNFLRLGDRPLAYHIFNTLINTPGVDEVYSFTSQPQIINLLPDGVKLLLRPKSLDGDSVKANELFMFAAEKLDCETLVLCHATGPFISEESIAKGINAVNNKGYDSSFSVVKNKTYCWFDDKPLNYDPKNMAQTQDLVPVLAETSGFYIYDRAMYIKNGTRIGSKPYPVEIDFRESIDIDEPEDFNLAQHMLSYNPNKEIFSRDTFFVDLANTTTFHKNVDHVSFDLDGVLIDSLEVMKGAWKEAMTTLSLDYPFSEYEKRIGIPFLKILEEMKIPKPYWNEISEVYDTYSRINIENIKFDPNVNNCLRRLKKNGFKISIVTSKSKQRTAEILKLYIDLSLVDFVVTPEDVPSGRGKPHPDPILYACVNLGVDPYNTIYVGDMECDKLAAVRSGAHFLFADWGYGKLESVTDVWFSDINDLVSFLEE